MLEGESWLIKDLGTEGKRRLKKKKKKKKAQRERDRQSLDKNKEAITEARHHGQISFSKVNKTQILEKFPKSSSYRRTLVLTFWGGGY